MPRPRKSTKQHKKQGTYRKDRHAAMPLSPCSPPVSPDWLSDAGRKKFDEVALLLADGGVLTKLDTDAISAYASAWCDYRNAADAIEKAGGATYVSNGLIKANPAHKIKTDASREMASWSDRLGLSPAARKRLSIEQPESTEADAKARFFASREAK